MVTYGQIGGVVGVVLAVGLVALLVRAGGKMAGFWNDGDGLSITDIIAVSIVGSYILFLITFAYKLVKGSLTMNDVSLLGQAIIPVTTVLGGYFVDRASRNFSPLRRQEKEAKEADIDARV